MKRSQELTPLSHDHHHGLFAAMKLKRATDETAGDAREGFLAYWHSQGRRHFAIEERLLLPALPADVPDCAAAGTRIRLDHEELRRRAAEATPEAVDALRELGELINAHVRFEEREVFPLVEARLSAAELGELGRRIAQAGPYS